MRALLLGPALAALLAGGCAYAGCANLGGLSGGGGGGDAAVAEASGGPQGVRCEKSACQSGQVCCWADTYREAGCVGLPACTTGKAFVCTDSAYCVALGLGPTCCAVPTNHVDQVLESSSCTGACDTDAGSHYVMCDPTVPASCGDAGSCVKATYPGAYFICQ